MNPEIKKQWVDALRSGTYLQGKGKLRSGNGEFCCLGVLCDLHAKATKTPWGGGVYAAEYLGHSGVLPDAVISWAGLQQLAPNFHGGSCGRIGTGKNPESLVSLNDEGRSFKEIADMVEEKF